jgi:hypothetical protein
MMLLLSNSAMPKKRKARAVRVANLQVARETLSKKWRKSTPAGSDLSDSESDAGESDKIV